MDFPDDDLSVRLAEWIELLTTLGADKIFLYNLEVRELPPKKNAALI